MRIDLNVANSSLSIYQMRETGCTCHEYIHRLVSAKYIWYYLGRELFQLRSRRPSRNVLFTLFEGSILICSMVGRRTIQILKGVTISMRTTRNDSFI